VNNPLDQGGPPTDGAPPPSVGHNGGPPLNDDLSIAADTLRGIKAISEFIGETPRRTFYLAERGYLPCGKIGANYIASKQTLRAHYARITGGAA
jgi:hypothetical protein